MNKDFTSDKVFALISLLSLKLSLPPPHHLHPLFLYLFHTFACSPLLLLHPFLSLCLSLSFFSNPPPLLLHLAEAKCLV